MTDQDFHVKLSELLNQISLLPGAERDRLQHLAMEAKRRHEKMRDTLAGLQDSLDHLRLSVKYLVFDLEATRRENEYLRKLLEGGSDAKE